MRWALAAAVTGASAVAGALAASARHEPARSLLGFAGGVFMKAPAESELDLIQVGPRTSVLCCVLCHAPPRPFFRAWLSADVMCGVQAHVVFRHGARSPFQDSPDAPKIWVRRSGEGDVISQASQRHASCACPTHA